MVGEALSGGNAKAPGRGAELAHEQAGQDGIAEGAVAAGTEVVMVVCLPPSERAVVAGLFVAAMPTEAFGISF